MDTKKSTRLGQVLLEKGLVTKEQLHIAVKLQTQRRKNIHLDQRLPTSLGDILIELGFIDRLQLKRGLNWQLLVRKITLVVSFWAPMMAVFTPSAIAQTTSSSSSSSSSTAVKRIEAESFSAMSGVRAEPTTDVGGGQNLGYMDANDWMAYKNVTITAPVAGSYKITYRLASLGGGGSFALKNADTNVVYDTVNVADTGGWQTWKNIERIVNLPAGTHSFTVAVVARGNGFNLNWFDVESVGSSLPLTIQAEDYAAMSGIQAQPTTDVGGGQNLGYLDANDWMSYSNHRIYIPATGSYKITYRIASPGGGGSFALKEANGSVTHDTVGVSNTEGWQTWKNVERIVTLTKGTHSFLISIIARGNGFNINWFKIDSLAGNASSSPSSAPSTSSMSSFRSSATAASVASSTTTSSAASAASSQATEIVHAVAGAVSLKWLIPNQRENGDLLDVTELGGYELRYRKATDSAYTYVSINDAWQNFYSFSWLSGNYIFQISAFDTNGLYSGFVNLIPH